MVLAVAVRRLSSSAEREAGLLTRPAKPPQSTLTANAASGSTTNSAPPWREGRPARQRRATLPDRPHGPHPRSAFE